MSVAIANRVMEELRNLGWTREQRGLELPEVQVVGPWRTRRPTRKAILERRFYVYGQVEQLPLPIDWLQDPHESRTWRYELHTLTWLREALARHANGRDVEMLAIGRDSVLDWARAHLRGCDEEQSEFAWYDMAVGLRAPYLAYVLRAGLAESMLGPEDGELLLEAAERHGAELADGSNYAERNNHGLFQDEGLYLLARQLPALPAAAAWRELALTRMKATLEATVSIEDGAHLEHSPAYQLAILDLIARLARNVSDLPELGELLDRMRRTTAWQTTPAGRMAQLGDTDDLRAPAWARDTASNLRGMNVLFDTGQAFIRERDSYLAAAAAHHGAAHKHADDTGLVLVESGQVLLADAGRWGYYEDEPDRIYARSAAAHNVLTIDGLDFGWRKAEPYGSGLEAAGEGAGWYAIFMHNPLLAAQRVEHRRALLYRPGRELIVLDEVRAEEEHEYTRRFHFGPKLEAKLTSQGRIALTGKGISATMIDLSASTKVELDRGREDPRRGWAYPGDRERAKAWTATLRSRGGSATFATALSMNGDTTELTAVAVDHERVVIERAGTGPLTVTLDGRRALVEN